MLYKNYVDLEPKNYLYFNCVVHKNRIISFGAIERSSEKWGDTIVRVLTRFWIHPEYRSHSLTKWCKNKIRFSPIILKKQIEFLKSINDGVEAMLITKEGNYEKSFEKIINLANTVSTDAFKIEFDTLPFPNNRDWFTAWCTGLTGYPLVDAGMRQLNQTGFMHNRLRMITSSFLVKDLLIDWRWGEAYFAEKLLDFDLASNNGGWQWAASVGCDAQPWFRIFNPITQSQKFDPDGQFIRRYCPELTKLDQRTIHAPWQASAIELQAVDVQLGRDYPYPLVNHASQREAALALFKAASTQKKSEY